MADRPAGHQRFSIFHSVLDVGCGTGVFLDLLRERGVARTLGVDRDPDMVAETRARPRSARARRAQRSPHAGRTLRRRASRVRHRDDGAADAFLGDDAYLVPARRVPIDGVMRGEQLAAEGWWLEPDVDALAELLRQVAAQPDEARVKAPRGSDRVRCDWSWERAAAIAAQRLRRLIGG